MTKTETVESLLAPSLRVSRPVAACSRCRSAKIKCDGKLPACSACERSGKAGSCTSANDEFARGKERSYVAALEAAAQRLQKRIDAAKSEGVAAPSNVRGSNRPKHPRKFSGVQRKEAIDVNELVSDFGFLTVNATSRDFQGFDSAMSFAKLLLTMALKTDLSKVSQSRLPPRYAIIQSIDRYLHRIYVLLPFFSETELLSSVSKVYQDASSTVPVTPLDFWCIQLVLAISNASLSQSRGDQYDQQALQHVAAAMELADYVIHPGSMAGVQALLFLVQYALLDPATFDSWYLVGMASRLVVDLGLHCEPSAETKITKEELHMRRRIFHSTYALDRLISMSLGRPFSFTDDSASGVPLPEMIDEQQPPSHLFLRSIKPSLYLFDIRRVQSGFYQTTRYSSRIQWSTSQAANYASSASNDIHSWYTSIPMSLQQEHQLFFNLERLYCQILVVAPNQKLPMVNLTDLNKALVFEYCAQYASQLHPVMQNLDYHPFLTYGDVLRTRWVGRQFLEIMWSDFDRLLKTQHLTMSSTSHNASPHDNCNRAITCLQQITDILGFAARRWDMSDLKEKFEKGSAVLVGRLRNRQHEFGPSPYLRNQLPPLQHVPISQYDIPTSVASQTYSYGNTSTDNSPYQSHVSGVSPQGQDGQHLSPPIGKSPPGHYLPSGSLPRRSYEFMGGGQGS